MKVIYRIPLKEKGLVLSHSGYRPYVIDGISVQWEVGSETNLNYINLIMSGIEIGMLKELKQNDTNPKVLELRERMFNVISYIANRILIKKGQDLVDLDYVRIVPLDIYPEASDEDKYFPTGPIESSRPFLVRFNVINKELILPDDFEIGFKHSEAFANYADGIRVTSPFLRYEQFFKIVEYFFSHKDTFDREVSKHASKYDNRFSQEQIHHLKRIRHRSMHYHVYDGHLNPSDLAAVHEVEANLTLLRELVQLLLKYPPK